MMSGEQAKATGMPDGVERLRGRLRDAVELIRRSGGGVMFERFPGDLQEEPLSDELADGVDTGRGRAAPDPAAATQRALVDAADELADTLAQLERTAGRMHPLQPTRRAQ